MYAIWYQFSLVVVAAASFFIYTGNNAISCSSTSDGSIDATTTGTTSTTTVDASEATPNHLIGAYILSGAVVRLHVYEYILYRVNDRNVYIYNYIHVYMCYI